MNDHVTTLMRAGAEHLAIPRPDVAGLVARGRRQRARRRLAGGIAAASVVGLLATSVAIVPGLTNSGSGFSASAANAAYLDGGAFAIGSTLYFGNSDKYPVQLDNPIRTVGYSKSGVVVSTGKDQWSDGDGPSRFWFVSTAGRVSLLPIDGVRHVDVGLDSSYVAYVERDGAAVIVRDASTGAEVRRFSGVGSDELSIWKGKLYFGSQVRPKGERWANVLVELDVRTGDRRKVRVNESIDYVRAGRSVADPLFGRPGAVTDLQTGKRVLAVPDPGVGNNGAKYASIGLSPDGQIAVVWTGDQSGEPSRGVAHNLDTGASEPFVAPTERFNWTPSGDIIYADGNSIKVCDVFTAECDSEPVLRLNGGKPVVGD
ncbi:MAG: hypothetical protein ACRCYU_06170 [Nocardioides sp.]